MTNIKAAIELITEEVIKQHQAGKVPLFLGARGLAALIYDRVSQFTESKEDDSKYLLDLAVKAVFAFACNIPEASETDWIDDEMPDDPPAEKPRETEENDDSGRWTPIAPGNSLPVVAPKDDK